MYLLTSAEVRCSGFNLSAIFKAILGPDPICHQRQVMGIASI